MGREPPVPAQPRGVERGPLVCLQDGERPWESHGAQRRGAVSTRRRVLPPPALAFHCPAHADTHRHTDMRTQTRACTHAQLPLRVPHRKAASRAGPQGCPAPPAHPLGSSRSSPLPCGSRRGGICRPGTRAGEGLICEFLVSLSPWGLGCFRIPFQSRPGGRGDRGGGPGPSAEQGLRFPPGVAMAEMAGAWGARGWGGGQSRPSPVLFLPPSPQRGAVVCPPRGTPRSLARAGPPSLGK